MDSFGGHTPEFLERNRKKMAAIDALSPAIRELVHEYNWTLIDQFLRLGVTKARHIKHLITASRDVENFHGNGRSQFHCHDCPHKFANPASSPNAAGISPVDRPVPSPNGRAADSER